MMSVIYLVVVCSVFQNVHSSILSNTLDFLGVSQHCLCRCGVSHGQSLFEPINNEVKPQEMPWLAFIQIQRNASGTNVDVPYFNVTQNSTGIIPGALISSRHVITAASPFQNVTASELLLLLGSNDICTTQGSLARVTSIAINPGYTARGDNDLALLTLQYEVTFNRLVSPICLPLHEKSLIFHTATVTLINRRTNTSTCVVQKGIFPILSAQSCSMNANTTLLTADKGCLSPVGSPGTLCGDRPGAPVMQRLTNIGRWRLVGVLSSASCPRNQSPLYTKITTHLQWIKNLIRGDCSCI